MKKILMLLIILALTLFGPAIVQATPCPASTNLGFLLGLGPDGCDQQDITYANFTYSLGSGDAAHVTATPVFQVLPGTDIHGWVFAHEGSWMSDVTLNYTITTNTPGPLMITSKDQINTGKIPNNTVMTDTQTLPDMTIVTMVTNGNTTGNETTQTSYSGVTSITTSSTTSNIGSAGNILVSYEQDFFQQVPTIYESLTAIPEPSTMLLVGSGLIGLVGYGRKKFFKK